MHPAISDLHTLCFVPAGLGLPTTTCLSCVLSGTKRTTRQCMPGRSFTVWLQQFQVIPFPLPPTNRFLHFACRSAGGGVERSQEADGFVLRDWHFGKDQYFLTKSQILPMRFPQVWQKEWSRVSSRIWLAFSVNCCYLVLQDVEKANVNYKELFRSTEIFLHPYVSGVLFSKNDGLMRIIETFIYLFICRHLFLILFLSPTHYFIYLFFLLYVLS